MDSAEMLATWRAAIEKEKKQRPIILLDGQWLRTKRWKLVCDTENTKHATFSYVLSSGLAHAVEIYSTGVSLTKSDRRIYHLSTKPPVVNSDYECEPGVTYA